MSQYPKSVTIGIGALTIEEVVAIARYGAQVEISEDALKAVAETRERIEELANQETPVYGVSTGFGALAKRHIPAELRTQLQSSLVRSHAAGSGGNREGGHPCADDPAPFHTVHRSHWCAPVVVETYAQLLNADITPVVKEYGSLGCSGDLAPLAHCALALLGEARCGLGILLPSTPRRPIPGLHRTPDSA